MIATTEGPLGEVVDWVDPHQLDPDYDQRTPPPANALPPPDDQKIQKTSDAAAPLVAAGDDLTASWKKAAEKAPRGTVPIVRPNFDYYVSGKSGKRSVDEFVDALAKPQPAGQNRLYASKVHTLANIGTQGWIQYVNPAQVPSTGAFSLTQLASVATGQEGAQSHRKRRDPGLS